MNQSGNPDPRRTSFSRSSALAAGGAALLASSFFRQGLSFLALIVTARLLSPEDFGVTAYFLVITGIVGMLQRQISMVLIRLEDVTYAHLHTVLTLQLILGFTGAGLFWLATPLFVLLGDPLLETIVPAVCAYSILTAIRNPRFLLYERGLRFSLAVVDETLHRVAYVIAAVWLSWLWRDYWALIYATFISFAVSSTFSYIAAPLMPKLSLAHWRDSMSFSSWATVSQLCQYLASRMPLLFIGGALGLAEAGIFRIGMRITGIVTKQFFAALQRVMYPGLADVSRSSGKSKEAFMRVNAILLGLSLPLSIGMALVAEDVVFYGFGEKWAQAAYVIWVMAPLSGIAILQTNVRAASYVDGTVRTLFFRNALLLSFVCVYMWVGTKFGFSGSLIAAGLSLFTAIVFTLVIARQFSDGHFFKPLTVAWRSFLASGLMAAAILGSGYALLRIWPDVSVLTVVLLKIGVGLVVYVLGHIIIWRMAGRPEGFETLLMSLLSRLRGRLGRKRA